MSAPPVRRVGALAQRSVSRSVVVVGLAAIASVTLAWPMLFTTSGLGGDWEHHLWYVWHQNLAIRQGGGPSMFLNSGYSVLYPQYAFYGGTIYVLAGTLAVVLGNSSLSAYILTYILGFMAAYSGWYWIGRSLGLGRYLAHAPALLFVTSACYLTLVYGQGDWPEFLAISMLPLMIASGLSIVRAERLQALPALALAISSIVFFGSHILTVLWASTLLGLTILALVVLVPAVRRQLAWRRLLRLGAVLIPALMVNAWFLSPMLAYASHTRIGSEHGYLAGYKDLHETMHLVAFHNLFTLSRATTPFGHPDYPLALPTLAIVWVLASIALVLVSIRRGTWVRVLVILAAIAAGIVILMTHAGLLLALPKPYTLLQFSYRLEGYVLMCVTATVLVALLLLRSGPRRLRRWTWTIVPVLALSVIGAMQQVGAYPLTPLSRDATFTGVSEVFAQKYEDYAYVPLPFVSEKGLPTIEIAPARVHDNRVAFKVRVRPGQLMATNIGGGPNLVHIAGATIVGTDERTHLVLAVGSSRTAAGSAHTPVSTQLISISPRQSSPVGIGRLLTFAGAAILLLELAALSVRRYRGSQRSSARSSGSNMVRAGESEREAESVDVGLL